MKFLIANGTKNAEGRGSPFLEKAIAAVNAVGGEYVCSDGSDFETVNAALGCETLLCRVTDSNFFLRNVRYGVNGDIAVVDASECCGLDKAYIKNPLFTTSYGLGEIISLVKKLNKKRVYVTFGKTSVNDCGAGVICALGGIFRDADGEIITPTGCTLGDVDSYDLTSFRESIADMSFTVISDERLTVTGANGCSLTTSAEKGAREGDAEELEKNARKFLSLFYPDFVGAGAGGGLGYCFKCFFGAETKSLAELLSERSDGFDCVIVEEGTERSLPSVRTLAVAPDDGAAEIINKIKDLR